jgi:hypothetical protein
MQSEARSAKNAPESAICGVLPYRPAPTGSVVWLVPISNPRRANLWLTVLEKTAVGDRGGFHVTTRFDNFSG